MGVRGLAPSMAGGPCRPRPASKSIAPNRVALVFQNELRKCVRTSHVGGSFFVGNGEGDRSIGGTNLRKGHSPFNGWRTLRPPRIGPCRPRPASKIIAPNRGSWGFLERTPEACTNLSYGRFVLCWKRREGIEVLAKPIFVRAQPFNGWRASRP